MSNGALTVTQIGGMFEKYHDDISEIAIPGLEIQRFASGIQQSFRKQPALLKCNPETIKTAIFDAAAVGVIPGVGERPLGYLIAYGPDCNFQLSVYGRIYLMRKHAGLTSMRFRPVFEGDLFTVEYNQFGTFWNYTPKAMDTNPDKLTHVWVEGTFKGKDGVERTEFHYITRNDIERIRQKSRQKDAGPWKNDYVQMAIKTAINQFAKDKQNSPIVSGAIQRDELRDMGRNQWDMDAAFEGVEGDAVATPAEEPKAIVPAASQQTVAAMTN